MYIVYMPECNRIANSTLLTSDTGQERIVSGLLIVVVVPEKSITLAGENTRDPRILVRDTPDGHSDADLDSKAGRGHTLPGGSLLSAAGLSGRGEQTDIDLRVDDVDAKVGGRAQSSLKNGLLGGWASGSGSLLGGHVALVTDTVDLNAVGLDEVDDAGGTLGLLRVVLEVVVIVFWNC